MTSTPAEQPGRRVDERVLTLPFECLKSIPGGINEVRVWHDPHLGCQRVGKRIDVSNMEGDDALPEPSTLQMIDHANVVPVLGAAEVSGYPRPMRVIELITPFYERGSITDALLREEPFLPSEAVAVVQAALRGLAEIHDVHGIAHRDVKSGNILLTGEPNIAVLADLGLAGMFDPAGEVPAVNNPTLYSPPEVMNPKRLSRTSDLYPFALILRELLGGALPYADAEYTTSAIVRRLVRGRSPVLPRDAQLPIWTPRHLRRIIRKTGQRQMQARFQTARDLDAALSRAIVIDWQEIQLGLRWEAPYRHGRGRHVAVEVRRMRNGNLRLATLTNQGRGWRRSTADVDVADLASRHARDVFDQAADIASVR